MLHQDVAGVQPLVHPVNGQSELVLAADQRPQHRGGESGEFGQQGIVHVQRSVRRELVELGRHPGVPAVDDDDVGFGPLHQVDGVVVDALGEVHRDVAVAGEVLDRLGPDRLVGLLAGRMRDGEGDVVVEIEQRLKVRTPPRSENRTRRCASTPTFTGIAMCGTAAEPPPDGQDSRADYVRLS